MICIVFQRLSRNLPVFVFVFAQKLTPLASQSNSSQVHRGIQNLPIASLPQTPKFADIIYPQIQSNDTKLNQYGYNTFIASM